MSFKLSALFILNVFLLTNYTNGRKCTNINAECDSTIYSKKHGVLKVVTDKECEYDTDKCVNGLLFEDKNGEMFCIEKGGRKNEEELTCGRKGNRKQFERYKFY